MVKAWRGEYPAQLAVLAWLKSSQLTADFFAEEADCMQGFHVLCQYFQNDPFSEAKDSE